MAALAEPKVYRWEEVAEDNPIPLLDRRRIMLDRIMLANVKLHKGCHVATHSHDNEQVACVISGSVRFRLGEEGPDQRLLVLGAGDILHLPSNLPHGVDALEETHILDLLSPPGPMGVDKLGRAN